MSKVTYLLGAGASANALPVISTMFERMRKYIANFLKYQNSKWSLNGLDKLIKGYETLLLEAEKHVTIDTYAKKLYLQRESVKLNNLKTLISTYFVWEQTQVEDVTKPDIYGEKITIGSEGKRSDPRYDSFLATYLYLNDEKIVLNENLSIVTWNYDYQLEIAFHDYTKLTLEEARQNYGVFPREGIKDDDSCRIIKLNGTADLHNTIKERAGNDRPYSTNRERENIKYGQIYTALEVAINQFDNLNYHLIPTVSFAWEAEQSNSVKQAKRILSSAETLVVIGYSFPIFNREIDKLIFKDSKFSKVYLQCLSKEADGISSRITTVLNKDVNVEFIPDLNQFFVPYDI